MQYTMRNQGFLTVILLSLLLPAGAGLAADSPAAATAATTGEGFPMPAHSLQWALDIEPAKAATLGDGDLMAAASWLWFWQMMNPVDAPVKGDAASFLAATRKSVDLLKIVMARSPKISDVYWMAARANYVTGELLPDDATAERTRLYEEMIQWTGTCIKTIDPKNGSCWHFYSTGTGRLATTRGVLKSLFAAGDIEKAWLKGYDLKPVHVEPNGDTNLNNIRYGLGVFYRLLPDSWIVKLITGTRGDIDKSIAYFRAATADQPYRLELQKELGVALLCAYDRDDDRKDALDEGIRILKRVVAGDFDARDIRATDDIDKRQSADMIAHPDRACGYSRDGYEDVDADNIDKDAAKKP